MGWGVFVFSFIVYLLTLEPTVSFWDCGEFIASSYKLQIGHPPGAPFFQLVQRVISLFAPGVTKVAFLMNAFSALTSAATIMFLYWTIVRLAEKFQNNNESKNQQMLIIAAGAIGSLTFAFTDSFWFSAVEAEVYAFSSLFTAIVFWAILKWEQVAEKEHSTRWIVLIAYFVGLSIGVHLLNLLAIPAIALIFYFKKYEPTRKGIITTLAISAASIVFIMYGIVQGSPNIAQSFEILFVNSFGLPYNSGLLFFILLLSVGIVLLIRYTHRKKKVILNLIIICIAFIFIGFGSYAMLMIRSAANPPMDENDPENAYTLMRYLNRTQYGTTPIFSGYYFNAPAVSVKQGKPVYYPKNGKYIKVDGQPEYEFDNRFKTIFPRMHSSQQNHEQGYKSWANIKGKPVSINGETTYIPTFSENLRFFFSYQLDHMYFRYFMWNFSGRQNDKQGHGDILNGNWLTGIGFIDKIRLGHNGNQPKALSNPETTNRYFMLPFLLGLLGLFFHYRQNKKDFWVTMLLFFMTGIAIVLYLNQSPYQPRERDYAYAGSFYAFAIWIGLGVMALGNIAERYLKNKAHYVAIALGIIVPVLVLAENYNDHDRSGRYIARDLGKNYLNSCAKNAILFTYGDNDTFPLWYVQDVENNRPDVRICNVTLLNGDWYINQMKQKMYESDPLPISMTPDKYEADVRNTIVVRDDLKKPIELSTLMKIILSDDPRTKVQTQGGGSYNYLPSRQIKITVDKQQVLKTGTVSAAKSAQIVDTILIDVASNYLTKSDIAILDMLANNNWERPIYMDLSVMNTSNIKLDKYMQNEGFAYRFVPIKSETEEPSIDTDILYDHMMNRFAWGNLNNPKIFLDENTYRTTEVVRIKDNFFSLSEQLIVEGKNDKARNAIDKAYQILPLDRFYTSYYDIMLAGNYYRINDNADGDKVMKEVANQCFNKINFYLSLGRKYIQSYQREMNRELAIVKEVVRVTNEMGRTEMKNEVESELQQIVRLYGVK